MAPNRKITKRLQVVAILWPFFPAALAAQDKPKILRWATFPPRSVNLVMTSRMASVVDKHDKSSSRVASFAGYRDHVPLIGNGESDFGILYLEKATLCTAGITFREV